MQDSGLVNPQGHTLILSATARIRHIELPWFHFNHRATRKNCLSSKGPPMKTFADYVHTATKRKGLYFLVAHVVGPVIQPLLDSCMIFERMIEHSRQVRLTLPPLTLYGDWPSLCRPRRFDDLQHVMRWIGDAKKLFCRHLRGAGVIFICQLNRGTFFRRWPLNSSRNVKPSIIISYGWRRAPRIR